MSLAVTSCATDPVTGDKKFAGYTGPQAFKDATAAVYIYKDLTSSGK